MDINTHKLDGQGFPVKEPHLTVFEIYAREAKLYDTAMIERWRTAMDGLLIFAGLFSAALTAFIVESYKTLQPDNEDKMVLLLNQISQQLSMTGSSSPQSVDPQPTFSPPWTAIATNILWFISLGLSLACAVAATLVQQWARNYVHAIERRPSAERRARMRMFLFDGVEKFRMSHIIDGIPALLHLALFTFLLGLVFFIKDISSPVYIVAIMVLLVSLSSYLVATSLPLFAYDSPIQTPLTRVVWQPTFVSLFYWICGHALFLASVLNRPLRISWTFIDIVLRTWFSALPSRLPPHFGNIVLFPEKMEKRRIKILNQWTPTGISLDEVRVQTARDENGTAFWEREMHAFSWLVECLDEDREILPFLEAIPTFVFDRPVERQRILRAILINPRIDVPERFFTLVRNHISNPRLISAYVDFYLCLDSECWNSLSPSLFAGRHRYFSPEDWELLFKPSEDLFVRMCCLEASANFTQAISLKVPPGSALNNNNLDSFIRASQSSTRLPSILRFWKVAMAQTSDDTDDDDLESFIIHNPRSLPYLVFAKLHLDARTHLTMSISESFSNTVQNLCDQLCILNATHVPRVTQHTHSPLFGAFPLQEQIFTLTIELVISTLDSRPDVELLDSIWGSYYILFEDLLHISQPPSLQSLNRILQSGFWVARDNYLRDNFYIRLFHAHANKFDPSTGRSYFSTMVRERVRAFENHWFFSTSGHENS